MQIKPYRLLLDNIIIAYYNNYNLNEDALMNTVKCKRTRPKRQRPTLSITIDPHVLDGLKKWMEREGETNISAVIQGFIDCGIRDTCEGCPFYEGLPEDEKEEIKGKAGVGKWIDE